MRIGNFPQQLWITKRRKQAKRYCSLVMLYFRYSLFSSFEIALNRTSALLDFLKICFICSACPCIFTVGEYFDIFVKHNNRNKYRCKFQVKVNGWFIFDILFITGRSSVCKLTYWKCKLLLADINQILNFFHVVTLTRNGKYVFISVPYNNIESLFRQFMWFFV